MVIQPLFTKKIPGGQAVERQKLYLLSGPLAGCPTAGTVFDSSIALNACLSMVVQLIFAEPMNSFLFRVHTNTGTFICAKLLEK